MFKNLKEKIRNSKFVQKIDNSKFMEWVRTSKVLRTLRETPFVFTCFFPLLIFYYEVIFHVSTVGDFFQFATLVIMLLSFAYGALLYLIVSLFKNKIVTLILTAVGAILPAVMYLVEYFVYKQFKMLYDVNTVTDGASDAMSGFKEDAINLVFSADGLFKIFLYFLPLILLLIFSNKLNLIADYRTRIVGFLTTVFSYGTAFILIITNAIFLPVFTGLEYNFNSAVTNFGLITGVALDVQNNIQGTEGQDFDIDAGIIDIPVISTPTPAPTPIVTPDENGVVVTPEPIPTPVEYGYHVMNLKLDGGNANIQKINKYVSSVTPAKENQYTGMFKGKNLIFITAEAFSAELIDPKLTPTLYRLANKGIQFTDYYQPNGSGTTGGEYLNVFGMIPTAGGSSFKKTASHYNYMTIGSQLNRLGYYGKAFHNNSYTFYDRNKTHVNLGYSDGFMGYGNGMEKYVKNVWPQSDAEMFAGTLPTYIDNQPFNVYYMSVSGHSAYTRSGNSMTSKHWNRVKDLPYSDEVKGYIAANLDFEDAMAQTVAMLEEKGIADDTVICIAADHFPYGLDDDAKLGKMPKLSELYGYNVTTSFQRDHSALIIWSGCLEDSEPIVVSSPTSSMDILPTLSNLFGTEYDSRLFPGRDVFSDTEALVFNASYDWKTNYGTYYANKGKFIPNEGVEVPDGYVDSVKAVVRNKLLYCELVLENDYFRYLFK